MIRIVIWITFLVVITLPTLLFGQNTENEKVTVSGNLFSEHNEKLAFTEVYLFENTNNTLVKTELTDNNGAFVFASIPKGSYTLKTNLKEEIITISTVEVIANVDLGNLLVKKTSEQLKEVVIEKKKAFIERKLDKLVVNVENSIASAGNNVLEVLQRSPGVMVNEDSGINLKGKSGVVIMIDGKPTPLSGADLMAYLKSIPASNIQTIEIITNPSARYDAAGNAGIINIKFKRISHQR